MKLSYEREYPSAAMPGLHFRIRRISFATRLRFLSENYDTMQRLKFLRAGAGQTEAAAELEIDLSRRLLETCLAALGESSLQNPVGPADIDWLLTEAPTELCVEVLARVGDEITLTEARRKN